MFRILALSALSHPLLCPHFVATVVAVSGIAAMSGALHSAQYNETFSVLILPLSPYPS
jgi:hypothetical protein